MFAKVVKSLKEKKSLEINRWPDSNKCLQNHVNSQLSVIHYIGKQLYTVFSFIILLPKETFQKVWKTYFSNN